MRFYKLEEFVTFLGDQGRDAIIIKRIATFEKFPTIGPISSIGQVFLGPFYYYLMAPFLFFGHLNPLSLAFGVALLSIVAIIFCYKIVKDEIDVFSSTIFVFLTVFSATIVEFNRFSWNPNLLPFFSFFTLYFFAKFFKSKKIIYAVLFGSFLSFSFQLHYLAFFLLIPCVLFLIINFQKIKKLLNLKNFLAAFFPFIFFYSPLIIFDLRHEFLNSRNLLKIFTAGNVVDSGRPFIRFLETNLAFFQHVFRIEFNSFFCLFIFLFLVVYFLKKKLFKNNFFVQINFLNFFAYLIGFSFLASYRYIHYYMIVYLSFFVVLISLLTEKKYKYFSKIIVLIFLAFYLYVNIPKYAIAKNGGNFQISIAKKIASSIVAQNPKEPYQIVPIPYTEMDGHIRYFLEIMGKRPLSEESNQEAKELYILCYEKTCDALNHPQWQIAAFQNKKIEKTWNVDRVLVYKIIHGK